MPGSEISATAQIEFEIKRQVYCELKEAVRAAMLIPVTNPHNLSQTTALPLNWAAQVTLSLQVDEVSSLNPSLTHAEVLNNAIKTFGVKTAIPVGQSFNLTFGGTLSSTATRIDKFSPYYKVTTLMEDYKKPVNGKNISICPNKYNTDATGPNDPDPIVAYGYTPAKSSPFLIQSQLGIKEWLLGSLFVNTYMPSDTPPSQPSAPSGNAPGSSSGSGANAQKPDTITYEIKFIIVSSGNINPTWKLLRFAADTGGSPLFSAGRTRTHDLIITFGAQGDKLADSAHATAVNAAAITTQLQIPH